MPRATHPGPAALRNRNRVTNKTRLKVIRDSIEADSIVLDEDEEKARVVSTAGVDAEDANEHHLQAVLSAAASRHQATARSTRSGEKESAPTAYIPTPDSTGIVQNYEEHIHRRWKDPFSYVKSSDTIEEATSFALANGFIYYMDERDKDWLDRNNEQARGEGMSSQGSVTSSSTRSGRSAKAKGKEPDFIQAVSITEDEFELVMSIYEKVTHEKTEFLHHGLEQGAPFPPFSDYQDTFAYPLQQDMFAAYSVPDWVPPPQQILRYARIIYPYWRERRLERSGHRIIPAVNLDESDTKNESYICFRRREIKAVRKTRASQASYSDRMVRLQSELSMALDIVRCVQRREAVKRDSYSHNHTVWDRRRALADLKRAHPSLGSKEDDELFLDKEKPPKKPKVETSRPIKIRQPRENGETGSPIAQALPQIRPKERLDNINIFIARELKAKTDDKNWEDAGDNPHQSFSVSFPRRTYKHIPRRSSSEYSTLSDDELPRSRVYSRRRVGRGGGIRVDRRHVNCTLRAAVFDEEEVEAKDRARRLEERFRYDDDDSPPVAVVGNSIEEQDRKLVDEWQSSRLLLSMSMVEDSVKMATDPTLRLPSGDVKPYHLGPQINALGPKPPTLPTQRQPAVHQIASISAASSSQTPPSPANGTPISVPTQVKKLTQNISSSGGLRAPSSMALNGSQHPTSPHTTPPSGAPSSNFVDAQATPAKSGDPDVKMSSQGSPNGLPVQGNTASASMASPVPPPSKPLVSTANMNVPNLANGYHIPAVNGYPAIPKAGYMHSTARHNGLSIQQMQSLSAMLPDNSVNIALRQPGAYVMPNGAYPMQIPGTRPMQWPMAGQHTPSNRAEGIGVDNSTVVPSVGSPGRAPSASGIRAPQLARGTPMPTSTQVLNANQGMITSPAGTHIARLTPHSPSPHILSPNLAAAQVNTHSSPTRTPQTAIPTPSPSLQSRQLVGGSGAAGY